ncbi:VOC family protein [Martelella soudanensis]|uniref:VOC family protein n=1 Tax=unclassified Martelella TaxID=2629616 RepID=UPI0015DF73E4|nr:MULTISPECIES: VOC family protein [unclassified Martelella]
MKFDRRISMITLGVEDIAEATAFYERLGWSRSSASQESVTFFALDGIVLGLFGRKALAEDAGIEGVEENASSFSGVALAYNLESEAEVDAALAFAESCGARIVKPAEKVFWGGYSGYFADPDGHLWEVAFNPFSPLDENGHMVLPE